MASQPPNSNTLNVEERDDGYLFRLRNEVHLLIKWHSQTQLQVEIWRKDQLLPPDVGNLYTSAFRNKLAQAAINLFGKENVPHIAEDIDNVAIALSQPIGGGGQTLKNTLQEKSGPSVTERLVLYARQAATLFHTPDKEGYAAVRRGGHSENYRVRSRDFRLWLRHEFWSREKRKLEEAAAESAGALFEGNLEPRDPEPIRDQALADALSQIEALALFEGKEEEVYIRIAEHGDGVYIDLVDEDWRVVEVTPAGWRVISDPPTRFIRLKGMSALPLPDDKEKSLEPLRNLLNLQGEEGEHSFRLILAWLVQALRGQGPYPLLVLLGERGTAKSTAARILRSLVDPSTVQLRREPKTPHDLYIDAVSSWCVAIDNISSLPKWLSDTLCMLATGGGFTTRQLFTDREQELFEAMRPAILNGISDVATRDDLVQRSLIVRLPMIKKYKPEREIYGELERVRPQIFGALLDAMSAGLLRSAVESDEGREEERSVHRMADFARWAVATEVALGGEPGSFMKAHGRSAEEGVQDALEASPLSVPLWQLAKEYPEGWVGTANEMLKKLSDLVEEDLQRSKEWPKAANALSRDLKRLAPLFREGGDVWIEELKREGGTGAKKWRIAPGKGR